MVWFYILMALVALVVLGILLLLAFIGAYVLRQRLRRLLGPSRPSARKSISRIQGLRETAYDEMDAASAEYIREAERIFRR